MTIARELPNRIVWKCDICGGEDIWQSSWSWYGSYLLEEEAPGDLLTMCSNKCRDVAEEKMKNGLIKLPRYKARGCNSVKRISDRIGY